MTEPLFFDTDCISAFLWVDHESILSKLFPGRIVIPKEVYDELSHPGVNRVKGLKAQVDLMIQAGDATIETITVGTDAYELYQKLTNNPDPKKKSSVVEKLLPYHSQRKNKVYLPVII